MPGLCPSCNALVTRVFLDGVSVEAPNANWVGVSYRCPHCQHILSVSLDPIELRDGIVSDILDELRRRA
jgi:hypothetical protein